MPIKFPKIGMRMVKSSLASLICLIISHFFNSDTAGIYMILTAILCIQPDMTESVKIGFSRLLGTVFGAIYGLVTILLLSFFPEGSPFIKYILFSFFILLCIYTNVLVGTPNSSYVTCVVYLSIVLFHTPETHPYLYAFARFWETTLGVLVAIVINAIPFGHSQNSPPPSPGEN